MTSSIDSSASDFDFESFFVSEMSALTAEESAPESFDFESFFVSEMSVLCAR